jgi:hypothetical protein
MILKRLCTATGFVFWKMRGVIITRIIAVVISIKQVNLKRKGK